LITYLPLIAEVAPWKFTFIAVGLPGLLVAAVISTVSEPVRRGHSGDVRIVPPWKDVIVYIRANKRI
jgi:hypothetical protein